MNYEGIDELILNEYDDDDDDDDIIEDDDK